MILSQLWAMARCEFKMHWRRRALFVILAAMALVVLVSLMLAGDSIQNTLQMPSDEYQRVLTTFIVFASWAPIGVTLALILPIVAAEAIPLDKQSGVRELLDSLPLSTGVYLTGKLLGVWLSVLVGLAALMTLMGIAWWLKAGPFLLRPYLEMWLIGATTIAVLNSGLGLLVAAGQPNRRRAILAGILVVGMGFALGATWMNGDSLAGILSLARGPILTYYLFNIRQDIPGENLSSTLTTTPEAVVLTILAGIVEVVLAWLLIRWWIDRRWKQT